MRSTLFVVLLALSLTSCAINPVTGIPDFVLFSEQQEVEVGRRFHQEILKSYALYDDPQLAEWVSEIGAKLARESHRPELAYHFFVLDSDMVNAFALPGGYVYITRGMLAYMDSEAQLAGVLGHEIGHVTARHGVRQQSRGIVVGMLGSAAAAATGSGSIHDVSNVLGSALLNGYGRRHELEADRLGAEYLTRSGYDPRAMAEVIRILRQQEDFEARRAVSENRAAKVYHGLLASHPDSDRRLRAVVRAAGNHALAARTTSRADFLARLDGLVFGHSPRQGILRDGEFLHHELDLFIRLPARWYSQSRPDRLLSASPERDAIIQVVLARRESHANPEVYLAAAFEDFESAGSFTSSGLPMAGGRATLLTPFGERHARVAAVFHRERVFVVAMVVEEGDNYDAFDNTVRSMRPLTADEREATRPLVIVPHQVSETFDFATLARDAQLGVDGADMLRLLNGRYPDGEVEPGEWIKLLRRL